MNYETIMSLIELPPDTDVEFDAFKWACFNVSLTSRRKSERFWLNLETNSIQSIIGTERLTWNDFDLNVTYLSRFFIDKLRSTFSIKLSNQCAIVCCLSSGWDRIIFSFIDLNRKETIQTHFKRETFLKVNLSRTWNNLHITKSNRATVLTMTIDFCNLQT